jgi:hypothetical protein
MPAGDNVSPMPVAWTRVGTVVRAARFTDFRDVLGELVKVISSSERALIP